MNINIATKYVNNTVEGEVRVKTKKMMLLKIRNSCHIAFFPFQKQKSLYFLYFTSCDVDE